MSQMYKENGFNKLLTNKCYTQCPLECDSIQYRTYQTNLGSISVKYINKYKIDVSLNKLDEMYLIAVYNSRTVYTLINQIPKMTLFELVSSVGGTLGLFVGLSFFPLVEIIEIILELIGDFLVKTKRNNVAANLSIETKIEIEINRKL